MFERDEALAILVAPTISAGSPTPPSRSLTPKTTGAVIHDLSQRRQLIRIGEDMVNTAYDPTVDAESEVQIEASEQRLYNLAEKGRYEGGFRPFAAARAKRWRTLKPP